MFYGSSSKNPFESPPIPHPFSFHHKERVWKGKLLCREGAGVLCAPGQPGEFDFKRNQKIKDCYLQVEGQTVYIPKMVVHSRQIVNDGFLYCLRVESILPHEAKKLEQLYTGLMREHEVEARR
ncbi:hypothetical protein [Thiomicrospira sp. WB1]|uniref:hypothetical protein n=1 Tax=Thiomicrospira sp. WB1 TaxID=1685380 RepID=UPI0007463839|nr:hypothetical protein [Thiomicrospira sp. WB1]KUJ71076.1 hypothetical protein AVO41_09400 [Thiomicrospira sp. WB1]